MLTLFLLFHFFSSFSLQGQSTLFLNELSPGNVTFTTSEQSAWDSIAQNPSTNSIRLVEIAHLPSVLSNNQVTFLLPGALDTLRASGFYFQKESDTIYTWWGEFSGRRGHLGMASNDSGKVIAMSLDGQNYMFHPLSARYNAQVELKQDTFVTEEPELEPPVNITTDPSCDFDDCKGIATVLVLLTPEAIDEILGRYHISIQNVYAPIYLALGVQTLNFALLNSGVVGKSARFVVEEFDEFEYDQLGDIVNDLNGLSSNSSAWGIFHTNRADLMVLLTDSRYLPYSGAADLLNPAAIVSANYMWAPEFVFTHEVGHLLGARHNRESNGGDEPDEDVCNYGYRFLLAGVTPRYTVMAKMLDPGDQRILAFSNPRINVLGTQAGAGDSDNAAYISKTFCDVADTYSDDELQVDISGPLTLVCPQTGTYTLSIDPPGTGIPGNGPYNISWIMGESPFTYPSQQGATGLGHSSSVSINSGNINYDKFWLYVHVLSSDGVMASDLIEVEVDPCGPVPKTSSPDDITTAQSNLRVFPNPSTDHLVLQDMLPESNAAADYLISNALGQIVSFGNFFTSGKGDSHKIHFSLETGIYSLQVRTQKNVYSCKFIVQH